MIYFHAGPVCQESLQERKCQSQCGLARAFGYRPKALQGDNMARHPASPLWGAGLRSAHNPPSCGYLSPALYVFMRTPPENL